MYPNQFANPQGTAIGFQAPIPGYPPPSQAYPPPTNYPPANGIPGGYPPPTASYPPATGYPSAPSPAPGYGALGQIAPQAVYPVQPYQPPVHNGVMHANYGPPQMQAYVETPTIKEAPFNAEADAKALRKAMKGMGTDEAVIIDILSRRTNSQRQQIKEVYKSSIGRDLIKDLKSELSGKFETVILSLMTSRPEFLAQRLFKAMDGIGTREKTLIDIICTNDSNKEIRDITNAYQQLYKKALDSEMRGETSGCFKKLLTALNMASRSEDPRADPTVADNDAQALYQAGEKRMGTDESVFINILTNRSFPQIRLMLDKYQEKSGNSLEKAIKKEFSGDIQTALVAIVKSAKNKATYFAERLNNCLAGLGTKDDDLITIVVSRAEIDMENIKQEYQKLYKKSLAQDISGDTSGNYKRILVGLVGM